MVYVALLAFIVIGIATEGDASGNPLIRSRPTLQSLDVMSIGYVLSAPRKWNLRLVRFRGTVSALRTIPHGPGVRDTHVFTLGDETGHIEIFYSGTEGLLRPLETDVLAQGNSIDAVVIITITDSVLPGSEAATVTGKLRWVGRPNDF